MVYQIYYGDDRPRRVMFDIEVYLAINDSHKDDKDKWYVEMHSSAYISGAVEFLMDKAHHKDFDMNFPFYEFRDDCNKLEELRGWLWETHNNYPRTMKEASKDKDEWMEYIKKKIYDFAEKYGLYVNED